MLEWVNAISEEDAIKKCRSEFFINLILNGFDNGIKGLDFIRKHKALRGER